MGEGASEVIGHTFESPLVAVLLILIQRARKLMPVGRPASIRGRKPCNTVGKLIIIYTHI